jgi:L-seryl-tRNA(Ser) seleniumtransferase
VSIYASLGVRRVINADARLTKLGGSLMPEPVLRAMEDAAGSYVDMHELQRAVGAQLAELTNNEAAYVATGAAAGIFLTVLACMTGPDQAAVDRLPSLDGLRNEVVFQRVQRFAYLPAAPLTGATLVEIGAEPEMHPAELEAAITDRTAAVLYVAGEHLAAGALPLPEVIEIAHARGVPVIVDAAAQLPPKENLWRFTRELGADLAIFSGGKHLRGPQASGLIVGRPDLIEACRLNGAPNPRLGRPMKVGKEEMLGLLAAVELYLAEDEAASIARYEAIVAEWIAAFDGRPGIRAWRQFPNEAGQPTPRCVIEVDPAITGLTGPDLVQRLWESDPRIAVKPHANTGVSMTPDTLAPGDEHRITKCLLELIGGTRR